MFVHTVQDAEPGINLASCSRRDWLVSMSEMIVSLSELVRHRDQATDGICY